MSEPDRGSASIWLLAIGFVVVSVGIGAALVGSALTDRHRAQVAADLGALAGARYATDGAGVACDRAGRIVAANGGRLVDCRLDGFDLIVSADVGLARARARAGPVRDVAPERGVVPVSASAPGEPVPRGLTAAPRSADPETTRPEAQSCASAARSASSTRTAAVFASGSLPLPHLGDCTHDGQPASHAHIAITSRVAPSQSAAAW